MQQASFPLIVIAVCATACTSWGPPGSRSLDLRGEFTVPESVAYGEPVRIDFLWTTGSGFSTPDRQTFVFVHLVDADGKIVVQDDHVPATLEEWRPGESRHYSRWLYPLAPLAGPWVEVYIGLYDGAGRWWFRHDDRWVRHPRVERLRIREDDRSGLPEYGAGWHPEQRGWSGGRARWSRRAAVATFPNPGQRAVLHFRANSAAGWLREPQTVRLLVGGKEVAAVVATDFEPITIRRPLSPEELGAGARTRVRLEVSPTVERASGDGGSREIYGVQVTSLYLKVAPAPAPAPAPARGAAPAGSEPGSGG